MARVILGVSGASGIVLARRALNWLASQGHTLHLVISRAAFHTATLELGSEFATAETFFAELDAAAQARVQVHRNSDLAAPIASGSFPCDAMLLLPCSMASLAAIAVGLSDNLLRRAAEVTLKERRRLIIVPREAPLLESHLDNMLRLTRMGAVIIPPVPAWYLCPKSLQEVEEAIVARVCEAAGLEAPPVKRWGVN
jgi:flavin prenyltransferase